MEVIDTVKGVRLEIYQQFTSLFDYVFKLPRFIEGQIELERSKLDDYFPAQSGPDADPQIQFLRNVRWNHESTRLFDDFPHFMAASNLFLAASLFEGFLHDFCKQVEYREFLLNDQKGNGVRRYFAFLRRAELSPEKVSLYLQIDAAIIFRNALLHADGRMDFCRDRSKIERLVHDLIYIEPSRRDGGVRVDENGQPEVAIARDSNRLVVSNDYAVRATAYFRDFLLEFANQCQGDSTNHPR